MAVVALAGRRYTGKTTAAELITHIGEEMHLNIRRVSFADPLREMFSKERGISMRMLIDPETKEEFRASMIEFANAKRKHNPRVLIEGLFDRIIKDEHVIIDDLRSLEELSAIIDVGGKPFKVVSTKTARESRGWKYNKEIDDGLLETELDLSGDTYRLLGGGQVFNTSNHAYLKNQLFDLVRSEYKLAVSA